MDGLTEHPPTLATAPAPVPAPAPSSPPPILKPAGPSTSTSSAAPQHHITISTSQAHHAPGSNSTGPSHHRQSFVDNLRNPPPPSPRSQRHPSFTQAALQDLVNRPPVAGRPASGRLAGRDWRDISVGELLLPEEGPDGGGGQGPGPKWVDMDTSVEEATKALLKNTSTNVVLVRGDGTDSNVPGVRGPVATFDFGDLNAYLLCVVGLAHPEPDDGASVAQHDAIARRAREREPISLRDVQFLLRSEALVALPRLESLAAAIEIFASGVHRILVTNATGEVAGILSQLRMLEFIWTEGVNFPNIQTLYPAILRDLGLGSHQIIAVNADSPLADALTLMSNEGLTSVAVVDSGLNVVGNISTADVRLLTSASSLPLLEGSCMHFISVILSERGVEKGRDPFPVFHVNPYSTLAHTVAKLVATRAHRVWVVESASPSPSVPGTPLLNASNSAASNATTTVPSLAGLGLQATTPPATSTVFVPGPSTSIGPTISSLSLSSTSHSPHHSPHLPHAVPSAASASSNTTTPPPATSSTSSLASAVLASDLPGAHLSGRLTGVVSLTDVLNLIARGGGLRASDPGEQRARRRRSSSSSVRPSLDGVLGTGGPGGVRERGSFEGRR